MIAILRRPSRRTIFDGAMIPVIRDRRYLVKRGRSPMDQRLAGISQRPRLNLIATTRKCQAQVSRY
jgi:hypothetical protein